MKSPKTEQVRKDRVTLRAITNVASGIETGIGKLRKPEVAFPVRSLGNVRYDPKKGYFEIGKDKSTRTLTVNTAKTFAQTLKMMSLSKELIETNDFATKRDAYYQSKNWGEANFTEQSESDTVMDDIEAMFAVRKRQSREQLALRPGGARRLRGRRTRSSYDHRPTRSGEDIERIDCTRFGSGAYTDSVATWSTSRFRDEGEVRPRASRPAACSTASRPPQVLAEEAHCILDGDGRRADAGLHGASSVAWPRPVQDPSGLRVRRLRPVRDREHLPDVEGRLRKRGAHQSVLLRADARSSSA